MRPRTRKGLSRRMEACDHLLITDAETCRGAWHTLFQNQNPIHLEIGCGKGKFITELASLHPELNFIALEKVDNVLILAMEKVKEAELPNVRFLCTDAKRLPELFASGEISRIYLNFSDPWPKSRHAKRRLTSHTFLPMYRELLPKDGVICFKTDNRPLFDFSVESFQKDGFTLSNVCYDLHHSDFKDNIMTEYEANFSAKGFPICRLEATP